MQKQEWIQLLQLRQKIPNDSIGAGRITGREDNRNKIWKERETVKRSRKESQFEAGDQLWQSNQIRKSVQAHSSCPLSILFATSPVSG